jgi:multidrug efflux pump subunit AcrB
MVDIDPNKLLARGLTPNDIVNAVNAQNLTLPAGQAKIANTQYTVRTNATPASIADLNNIPVKYQNGATVFLKDVGQVRDGSAVQQNIVREDGARSVLLSVIKNGNASTLDVVNGVRNVLDVARKAAPPGLNINELFDQSVFVKSAVAGVVREGAIAAGLTALMILLFLGSWRSTLIVMVSIPLAILSSLIVLFFLGYTIDTMTLGGLALAVGILVDDSTVTIENTHPPPHRGEDAVAASHIVRLGGHRCADTRLDSRHLLRVHLGGVSAGPAEIPVHAARACRCVRHARLLRPVADADADHHRPSAQG